MREIKIGVWDEDEIYAGKLAYYLSQKEKGNWKLAVFTKKECLLEQLKRRGLQFVIGAEDKELLHFQKQFPEIKMIWLRNYIEDSNNGITAVYKYQSAEIVYKVVKQIVRILERDLDQEKKLYATYSPVGRCGKTTMLLDEIEQKRFGNWLYIGLEEYSFLWKEEGETFNCREDFLYFLKERKEEKLLQMINEYKDQLSICGSPFDKKELNKADFVWLKQVLQQTNYQGVLLDIGTGILKDLEIFSVFDKIIVPYLNNEQSVNKKIHFEELLKLQGMENILEKIIAIDMGNKEDRESKIRQALSE